MNSLFFPSCAKCARQLHAAAVDHCHLIAVGHQVGDRFAAGVQQLGIFKARTAQFYDESHSKPSSSFQPHITFMFCTACPAAPFNRLSRHETTTSRLPSSASAKPRSQKFVRTTC